MLILSLDSTASSCSACVWHDGKILAADEEHMERGQDQRLMPLILDVIKNAGITFVEFDRVAVSRGPGSFTGLRIGLAAARGIGLASGKPVIGIDRFSIYRHQIKDTDKGLLVIINSKRKELFCKFYPVDGSAFAATMMTMEDIKDFLKDKQNVIVTGDGAFADFPNFKGSEEKETVTCARLAARADMEDTNFLPRPLYLRAPDVTIKTQVLAVKDPGVG